MIEKRIEILKRESELAEANLIRNLKDAAPIKLVNKVQNIVSSKHATREDTSHVALNSLSKIAQLGIIKKKSIYSVLIIAARIVKALRK